MQRWAFALALATWWLAYDVAAQAPGPLATSTEKLDYLLSTWRGQPVERVRKVFGREDATEMRGTNPVLVYEKLGLRLLRTAWINLNLIWGAALVVTGVLTAVL